MEYPDYLVLTKPSGGCEYREGSNPRPRANIVGVSSLTSSTKWKYTKSFYN
jgi:hypothetical protein